MKLNEMLMHERTYNAINSRMKAKGTNVALVGNKGMGKYLTARKIAASDLDIAEEELTQSLKFIQIQPENGIINADMIEKISEMAEYSIEGKSVVLIDDADKMSEYVQNKLLKLLEDCCGRMTVLLVCHKKLLDTVMSRCIVIEFPEIALADMIGRYGDGNMAAVLASQGAPGIYMEAAGDSEFMAAANPVMNLLFGAEKRKDMRRLFSASHAIREKDSLNPGEAFSGWRLEAYFGMLAHIFMEALKVQSGAGSILAGRIDGLAGIYTDMELLYLSGEAKRLIKMCSRKGRYNKNDYVELLMKIMTPEAFMEVNQ